MWLPWNLTFGIIAIQELNPPDLHRPTKRPQINRGPSLTAHCCWDLRTCPNKRHNQLVKPSLTANEALFLPTEHRGCHSTFLVFLSKSTSTFKLLTAFSRCSLSVSDKLLVGIVWDVHHVQALKMPVWAHLPTFVSSDTDIVFHSGQTIRCFHTVCDFPILNGPGNAPMRIVDPMQLFWMLPGAWVL